MLRPQRGQFRNDTTWELATRSSARIARLILLTASSLDVLVDALPDGGEKHPPAVVTANSGSIDHRASRG